MARIEVQGLYLTDLDRWCKMIERAATARTRNQVFRQAMNMVSRTTGPVPDEAIELGLEVIRACAWANGVTEKIIDSIPSYESPSWAWYAPDDPCAHPRRKVKRNAVPLWQEK